MRDRGDWLRRLTAGWPGVSETIKWQADRVFDVGGKRFAVTAVEAAADASRSFKVPDPHFLATTEQPGIAPALYAARFRWVLVTEPGRYGDDRLAARVRESYDLVAAKLPKTTRVALGL